MIVRNMAFLALGCLVACSPQPRSASYFQAHASEAVQVVTDCKTGAARGEECANAQAGVAAAGNAERLKLYKKGF
jgi:hypothetical protein